MTKKAITLSDALELNLFIHEQRKKEMDINGAFPSDYLKAADLQGREVTVTMQSVQMQELGSEQKPILFFEGKDKGLVLNKTNANTIADMFGPETDAWRGNRIVLFPTQTDFQGRQVACIRVKILNGKPKPQPKQTTDEKPDYGDEVPF